MHTPCIATGVLPLSVKYEGCSNETAVVVLLVFGVCGCVVLVAVVWCLLCVGVVGGGAVAVWMCVLPCGDVCCRVCVVVCCCVLTL